MEESALLSSIQTNNAGCAILFTGADHDLHMDLSDYHLKEIKSEVRIRPALPCMAGDRFHGSMLMKTGSYKEIPD